MATSWPYVKLLECAESCGFAFGAQQVDVKQVNMDGWVEFRNFMTISLTLLTEKLHVVTGETTETDVKLVY